MTDPKTYRKFMKCDLWKEMQGELTDQQQRVPHPPLQQPFPEAAPQLALPAPDTLTLGNLSVREAIARRRSWRKYTDAALSLDELAFLCWATQGVHEIWARGKAVRRTVPSAGSRHPFETYLVINRVVDVEPGLYRYLSLKHALGLLRQAPDLPEQAAAACHNQAFVAQSAVTFIWSALPYRTEWRYALMTPKLVNLDAGHVCQNLYLAAEAIGAGTCAIAAYEQAKLDAFLGLDGEDEFAIYVAPVGKIE